MNHSHPGHPHLPHPSLKHPGRWLWLFLLAPVVLGLMRLHFDVEVFDLLPTRLPAVEGLKLYEQHFSNARQLLITVKAKDSEAAESAARTIAEQLRRQSNLVAEVTWEPPWLEHPDQAAELMAYLWFNQPPAAFRALAGRLAPDKLPAILTATRQELATSLSPETIARLSYDPFGLTRLPQSAAGAAPSFVSSGQSLFASKDGTFRIIFVRSRPELRTYRDCERWLRAIKADIQAALAPHAQSLGTVSLGYTGRPAFVAEVAKGMKHDITVSVGGTAAIIALLFWIAHRRVIPMLWLLALLGMVLGCTLALGGLIYGTINVLSMGFAAILLGLAVDYAVVHYQEALAHPYLSIPQIRHAIAPSIFWAAVTTISAFLMLNFAGLPGLGQLGTLVGLGVALAATIMIFEYLPPLFPERKEPRPELAAQYAPPEHPVPISRRLIFAAYAVTVGVIIFTGVILWFRLPPVDSTANALRPRRSPAYAAMDEIQANLTHQAQPPLWLVFGGNSVTNVGRHLEQAQAALAGAVSNHLVASFQLPTALWPRPAFQAQNRLTARQLAAERPAFRQAALTNGFTQGALALTDRVLDTWQVAAQTSGVFWPTNPLSQWIFEKATARTPTSYFAFGLVTPTAALTTNSPAAGARLAQLQASLPQQGVWLSGWELLGRAIFDRVQSNMWKVIGPMIILVLLSLYMAFRRPPEILLSLGVLTLSGLVLLTVMHFANWSWNLLDLMSIPLVLGTGVDYSIFMQLALRRYRGDLRTAYRAVGRALLLCGGTASAAFGTLAWSSNAGMASLGQLCAIGIGSNMLIAVILLPIWWHSLKERSSSHPNP